MARDADVRTTVPRPPKVAADAGTRTVVMKAPATADGRDRLPSHPPAALRVGLTMTRTCYELARAIPAIGDQYFAIVGAGQREAENGIAYSGGARLRPEDLMGLGDRAVQDHMDALLKHFNDVLSAELVRRAYVALV